MDYSEYLNSMQSMIEQNNQWSAQQAERQMQFQEKMSNTAHQREVADLVAAGLNPVLSARSSGASTPNGAMADSSGSVGAMAQMLSTIIDTENANARAMLTLANRGSGGSTTASGNENFVSNLLMALGINRNQAKGIESTLNSLGFNVNDLVQNANTMLTNLNNKLTGSNTSVKTDSNGVNWKTSSTSKYYYDNQHGLSNTWNAIKTGAKNLWNALTGKK